MENLILGYSIPQIDKLMDDIEGIKIHGPNHRLINHNSSFLFFIKSTFGDEAFKVALLHMLVDLK